MATLVKEKRNNKKKHKEDQAAGCNLEEISASSKNDDNAKQILKCTESTDTTLQPPSVTIESSTKVSQIADVQEQSLENATKNSDTTSTQNISDQSNLIESKTSNQIENISQNTKVENYGNIENAYEELNSKLDRMAIPHLDPDVNTNELEEKLTASNAYLNKVETPANITREDTQIITSHDIENTQKQNSLDKEMLAENIEPSAPVLIFYDNEEGIIHHQIESFEEIVVPKPQCMPLEEAKKLFGGREMENIRVMAEREEVLVEAGPVSGPEHPLVDLLSTFSSSLRAVDRERTKIACSSIEEEKFRNTIWKIEKRKINLTEKCPCGSSVGFQGSYEHAELQQERLPVARMKLFGLLTDIKDGYCHHQHAAILAHCQIEQLVTEITESNTAQIREALALILQALRMCPGPEVLAVTLQRWAAFTAAALVQQTDLRHLLHLIQHMFRQSRTVRWATQAISFRLNSMTFSSAAQAVAILELLLTKPKVDTAQECTEETEEVWEEVDKHGSGSAVCAGALRERCLLAALHACPIPALISTLCLFKHRDINRARLLDWDDLSNGRNVLKSCCGVRTLLSTFERAISLHGHYKKLHKYLRDLTSNALHCLVALHVQNQRTYEADIADRISAELEAIFTAGFTILSPHDLHKLPTGCISDALADEYCNTIINGLHDKSLKQVPGLDIELPVLSCEERIRIVAHAALDRTYDHVLATLVMEFLLQTSLKKKPVDCKGSCKSCADEMLPKLLAVHPSLYTVALHVVADLYQAEPFKLDSMCMLALSRWRPTADEVCAVLDDWQTFCATLIPKLLLAMDYSPERRYKSQVVPGGVSVDVQLTIGTFLCRYQQNTPEWAWLVLRRINVHKATWGGKFACDPDEPPQDLFGSAYAVLSSSWGHSVPLICTSGVSALCRVAATRPREAVHCLSLVMTVMAQSPESITHTPQFLELCTILLSSGPTVLQRALGLGPVPGSELLLRAILKQLENNLFGVDRASLLSAWLHTLWRPSLHHTAYTVLDTALLACRVWSQFDSHAGLILQDSSYKDHLNSAVRNASIAPLLCECLLRNCHAQKEVSTGLNATLLNALHLQRVNNERIHVDNALKQIDASISSEDLAIYRTATAVLIAPLGHPSHLTLWRLLMHLYLQRPPCSMYDTTPPVGPLFFSGVIKSRVLNQLRNKLTETAKYHRQEIETLKPSQSDSSQSNDDNQNIPTKSRIHSPNVDDTCVLPELTIHDLTGGELSDDEDKDESDDGNSDDEKSEGDENINDGNVEGVRKIDVKQLIGYHVAGEKMILEFSRWLEEGDKVRAMPHHADIARFIPEPALEAAWNSELSRRRPPPEQPELPLPPRPAPPPRGILTPFANAKRRLVQLQRTSDKRALKPPIQKLNLDDTARILREVDKNLSDIDKLSREWSNEVNRVAMLDAQLWDLVTALRVPQSMPAVKKSCPNKCRPVTFHIAEREWCISPGAERGIVENRRAARMGMRRVAAPRPQAATGAAALLAIARHVGDAALARTILERTWRCAGSAAVSDCAYAHDVLVTLVETLADRWISRDGVLCASLISHWCKREPTALQQALIGAMVQPRRLKPADWPSVYKALLKAKLPSNAVFSYLSKFEMSRCCQSLDRSPRRELLETLLEVAQRWGMAPDEEHCVLLELIGVHTAALLNAQELSAHVLKCARASVRLSLPSVYWCYIVAAANTHAVHVSFDQLGHLLRELGMVWWDARLSLKRRTEPLYVEYAPFIAEILKSLHTAFVTNAVNMSYAMERVAMYAWSTARESWCAWIGAHASSLLPNEAMEHMLQHFIDHLLNVLAGWPGIEAHFLRQIFEWVIQNYMNLNSTQQSQECRVQMSSLLGKLATLPWAEYQWANTTCLQIALQISTTNDKEILSWCSATWRNVTAETWLQGVSDDQLAPTLATILYAFSVAITQHTQALDEATRLPWWRLPEMALHEALDRFFAHHHNPVLPYHDLPQFRLILFASELSIHPCTPPHRVTSQSARNKRAHAVSAWTRAACSSALGAHVPAHCTRLLAAITVLARQIEGSVGEIEDLLSRAVVIMCIEPAAASALPVWQRWVKSAPPRLVAASLTAVAALTTFEYFASLADHVVRAHIAYPETANWSEVTARWSNCHWSDISPLVSRGHLHAAYAVSRSLDASHTCRAAFTALSHVTVNTIDNEAMLAVWICYTCRIARSCNDTDEGTECREAALSLLRKWVDEPRMSLMRVLSVDTTSPTPNHRLLSRLAVCILTPSDSAVKAYEAACQAVLGSNPGDVLQWGKEPHAKRLPRLAMRLYPNCDRYFMDELNLVNDD